MDQIPGLSRKVSVLSRLILDQSRPARRLISPVGGLRMRCEQRGETWGSPRAMPHSVAPPSTRTWRQAAAPRAALPAMSSR